MASQEGKKKNGKASDFNWMDDEIQYLLEVCFDFKAESDYEGVNRESKRTKYEQIKSKFCEQYPEVEDEKFPRCKDLDSLQGLRLMKLVMEAHQVVKKLEKPNPLKSKQLTVE